MQYEVHQSTVEGHHMADS